MFDLKKNIFSKKHTIRMLKLVMLYYNILIVVLRYVLHLLVHLFINISWFNFKFHCIRYNCTLLNNIGRIPINCKCWRRLCKLILWCSKNVCLYHRLDYFFGTFASQIADTDGWLHVGEQKYANMAQFKAKVSAEVVGSFWFMS